MNEIEKPFKLRKRAILITGGLLIISIGNCFRIISNGSIRVVEFLSIIFLGMILGVFLTLIILTVKKKNKISNKR